MCVRAFIRNYQKDLNKTLFNATYNIIKKSFCDKPNSTRAWLWAISGTITSALGLLNLVISSIPNGS